MRLFTAIELSDASRRHLGRVMRQAAGAAPDVRWTPAEKLHLTLKFIGEVEDAKLPAVIEALDAVELDDPIELRCTGIVCFPPRGRARVVAAGVEGEVERLSALFERIEAALTAFCRREHRRYTPHVTIGRCRNGLRPANQAALEPAVAGLFPGPVFEADGFALFSSAGGVYTVCHRIG